MKKKVLIIEDELEAYKRLYNSLSEKNKVHYSDYKTLFDTNEWQIFPELNNAETFCSDIKKFARKNINRLFFYIYKILVEEDILLIFSDFNLTGQDTVGDTAGEKLINKIKVSPLFKYITVIGYTRNPGKIKDINQNTRKKLYRFIPLSATGNDTSTIRQMLYTNLGDPNENSDIDDFIQKINDYKSKKKRFDVVIMCALVKEYDAVKSLLKDCKEHMEYKLGYFQDEKRGIIQSVILSSMHNEVGLVNAALKSEIIIEKMKPRIIAMCGISGGRKGSGALLGDVCVAKNIYNWQSGKYTEGKRLEIEPDPRSIGSELLKVVNDKYVTGKKGDKIINKIINNNNNKLVKRLIDQENRQEEKFCNDNKIKCKELQRKYVQRKRNPRFMFGIMLSGSSVVGNESIVESFSEIHRKAYAFDMEGYAVAYVANERQIESIVCKTIVDYGNHLKGDDWHNIGCNMSAIVIKEILIDSALRAT